MSDDSTRNTTTPTLTKPVLVWDGECDFCRACAQFLARRTRRPMTSVAYQDADLAALGLTLEQCADAVQWVSADGTVQSAHVAVAACLRYANQPWPLAGLVISAPGVRHIASIVYRRVADRRRCALPTPPAK